jgi:hypothetical protein
MAKLTLRDMELGQGVVFVMGVWRTGTTLLRKILDSHTNLHSPAETWFLLPLINMWSGEGTHPEWNPKQAGVALQSHLPMDQFAECCRAFAGRFYAQRLMACGKDAAIFVDKTPFYLFLDGVLPALFPRAKFIVLARDPRGTVWSRHTWKHIRSERPENHFAGVAGEMKRLAAFLTANADRSLLVNYEKLCDEPRGVCVDECQRLCAFLGVPYQASMIEYGAHQHHEGYGDEKSREHGRPHADSVARYGGGMTHEQQTALLAMVDQSTLDTLGYSAVTRRSAEEAATAAA